MAYKLSFTEDDFSCPVCHEVFTDPVLLPCTHSFCNACLQEWWRTTQEKDCPVCKERHATAPPLNLALKNLCETFTQRRLQRSTEVLCDLHAETFKLFCQECLQPVCVVCRESKQHTDHRCRPVDEAALDYKKEVGKSLRPLKYKLDTFKTVKTKCDQTAEHLKVQAENTETQIKEVFKILHKYLHDEEEARITTLRKEEQQKSRMMTEKMEGLNRDISTISDAIRDLEEELKAEHVSFLQNYRTTVEKVQITLPPDPQPVSGELMDVAGHLKNLAFGVWEGMEGIVSYHPIILDPNTAWTGLVLSDDLTSLRRGGEAWPPKLPDNPERFEGWHGVLASEGFDSGTHSWDVEVGDNSFFELGVVVESNQRQGIGGLMAGQHWGIIDIRSGCYATASESFTLLSVNRKPRRIRVQLDWERGKLSFSDADTNAHLHTFTDTFTETIIPYFSTEDYVHPVKISQMKIRMQMQMEI